ncbi:flagellar hook-length control protein FliK [Falsibacillus pallidus]|uniref:flagellar hook-length control protein FliK n=1 Tax=Falsibacillus pallidus TaxID=493781 RepID=UPI003D97E8D6
MNVAGTIQSIPSGQAPSSSKGKHDSHSNGFKNILGAVFQSTTGKEAAPTEKSKSSTISTPETLNELMGILNQAPASGDLAESVSQKDKGISLKDMAKALGITEEKLMNSLKNLLNKLKEMKAGGLADKKKSTQQDFMGMLMNILSQLSMTAKDLFKQLPKDEVEVILKAGKVLEANLLTSDLDGQGIKKFMNLKDSLKQIKATLQVMQSDTSKVNQKGVLKTAFSHVLVSAQQKSEKAPSNQSPLGEITSSDAADGSPVQASMTKQEQFAIFTNKDAKLPSFESFVKQFSDILAKSQLSPLPNGNKLLIKLYPEQLGSLRIELLQKDGVITAKLLASTNAAKDLLEGSLSSLKNAFSQQHIQVDKIDIFTNSTEQQKFDRQQNPQQHQQQRREEQSGTDQQKPESGLEFSEELQELLFNTNI